MKACFVHPTFLPNVGGIDIAVYALGKELVKRQWDITVFARTELGIPIHYETHGIHVERRDAFPLYQSGMLPLFIKELSTVVNKCDIVQFENPNIWSLAALTVKAPVTLLRYFDFHPVDVASLVVNSGAFDAIICPTHHAKKELQEKGVQSLLEVISTGVDTDLFTPEGERFEILSTCDKNVVVLPARIDPHKGIETLLEAFSQVDNSILYITGGGESWKGLSSLLQKKYEKVAKNLHIEHNVIFGNGHPWEEMPAVYRGADVVVLTSTYESLGLVLMEAMACGKPVIGPDIPAVAEYITNGINGVLIEPHNPESIAEALNDLLSNPGRAEKIARHGIKTIKEYSLDKTVSHYIELVNRLNASTF